MIKYILIFLIVLLTIKKYTKEHFNPEIENLLKHSFVQKKIDKYTLNFMDKDKCITKEKFPSFIKTVINNLPFDIVIKQKIQKHYDNKKLNTLFLKLITLKSFKNVNFSNKICKSDLENIIMMKLK
jgi:hypothetical protein